MQLFDVTFGIFRFRLNLFDVDQHDVCIASGSVQSQLALSCHCPVCSFMFHALLSLVMTLKAIVSKLKEGWGREGDFFFF